MIDVEVYRDDGQVSDEAISAFERSVAITLPAEYKLLLSRHNGLRPKLNVFDFWDDRNQENDERDISFLGFYESDISTQRAEDIYVAQDHDVYGRDGLVAFGQSAGGDFICFDYRDSAREAPRIALLLHDDLDVDERLRTIPIAESFDDFMRLLRA